MSRADTARSKLLALVLRHDPGAIDITLDRNGWASVEAIVSATAGTRRSMSRTDIERVVAENAKRRFELSDDGERIRAVQGHSVAVDAEAARTTPPDVLYHGTATRFLDAIREEGLRSMKRTHVHLSADVETAITVGRRHGKPVVLQVDAKGMHERGVAFLLARNGVWLCDAVPSADLCIVDDAS